MNQIIRLTALLLIVALTACTAPDLSPTPPPDTPTTAPTIAATRTPIPTPTPAPTSTPFPTPDFLDSPVAHNDFLLSSSDDPNCQLPCWQGLRVGESNRTDVQRMFEASFGFDTTYDVFAHPEVAENAILPSQLDLPGMQAVGYSWSDSASRASGRYDIFALVDIQTGILQGMYFLSGTGIELGPSEEGQQGQSVVQGTERYQPASIAQTIRVLGSPDAIFFDAPYGFEIMLVYESGIAVYSITTKSWREMTVNNVPGMYMEFCLDEPIVSRQEFLVMPFELDDPTDLPVLHQTWILNTIEDSGMLPLEELDWVITKEEIVETAQSQENACLLFGPIQPCTLGRCPAETTPTP